MFNKIYPLPWKMGGDTFSSLGQAMFNQPYFMLINFVTLPFGSACFFEDAAVITVRAGVSVISTGFLIN